MSIQRRLTFQVVVAAVIIGSTSYATDELPPQNKTLQQTHSYQQLPGVSRGTSSTELTESRGEISSVFQCESLNVSSNGISFVALDDLLTLDDKVRIEENGAPKEVQLRLEHCTVQQNELIRSSVKQEPMNSTSSTHRSKSAGTKVDFYKDNRPLFSFENTTRHRIPSPKPQFSKLFFGDSYYTEGW